MNLENLQKTWNSFAESAPLWSVLTCGTATNFEWNETEFFIRGEQTVNRMLDHLRCSWIQPEKNRVLDFGCGVGRLSLNLTNHFHEVLGIDISENMVERANFYKEKLGIENCRFVHNTKDDLSILTDDHFDLIVSMITLQHMEAKYIRSYLKEFVRVLRPHGILYFQLPGDMNRKASYEVFDGAIEPEMEMHGLSRSVIIDFLESLGGKVRAILEDSSCGEDRSFRYIFQKESAANRTVGDNSYSLRS